MSYQALTLLGDWTAQQHAAEPEDWAPAKWIGEGDRPYFPKVAVGGTHALLMTGSHKVYGAGTNGFGQLGLGNRVTQFKIVPLPLFQQLDARMVSCGSAHSAVLATTGHVFSFGCGSYGRLGIGTELDSAKPRRVRVYAASDEGNVEIDVHFKAIACGDRHTLALSSFVQGAGDPNSRVYAWGDGGSGRLGNGSDDDKWYPTLIKHWMGAKPTGFASGTSTNRGPSYPVDVASISAGGRHSAAVTSDGTLYTWGDGGDGQLGHGVDGVEWSPRSLLAIDQVAEVSCGGRHTVARTSLGQVFCWGRGVDGQLGLGEGKPALQPTLVRTLVHTKVTHICAGERCSTFVTADGKLLVSGQLGDQARRDTAFTPTPLELERHAAEVACGHKCMIIASRLGAAPAGAAVASTTYAQGILGGTAAGDRHASPVRSGEPQEDAGDSSVGTKDEEQARHARSRDTALASSPGPMDVFGSADPVMRGMFDRFLAKLQQQHHSFSSSGGVGSMLTGRPVLADKLVEKILKLNAVAAGILETTVEREARQTRGRKRRR